MFSYICYKILQFVYPYLRTQYHITFLAGEIGAGKTTYAVKQVIKHSRRGWNCFSNDDILGCYKLPVDQLKQKCCVPKSLLIIDEASLQMNSRDFQKMALDMIAYFKLSRHHKNKIILISQTFNDTDKQIRDLASKVIFVRKKIDGLLSMPIRCQAKLGIDLQGQICTQYKIGNIGIPIFLPKYFKYFDSFCVDTREKIDCIPWREIKDLTPQLQKRYLNMFNKKRRLAFQL